MNVVIAGAGSVGRHMAGQLRRGGHQVTLIEADASVVASRRDSADSSGITWLVGDGCDVSVLERAGARTADVLTAVTGDDEDNLVISLLAKQEFGVPRVIARVNNPRNEWLFTDMWGVDVSVSTPHLLTSLVEEAVTVGSVVRLLSLEHGKARLLGVTLAPQSVAVGKRLDELGLPREAAITAVVRDGHVHQCAPDFVLRSDDEVFVLLAGDDESAIQQVLVG